LYRLLTNLVEQAIVGLHMSNTLQIFSDQFQLLAALFIAFFFQHPNAFANLLYFEEEMLLTVLRGRNKTEVMGLRTLTAASRLVDDHFRIICIQSRCLSLGDLLVRQSSVYLAITFKQIALAPTQSAWRRLFEF
jgi:hypothetical protein